MTAKTRNETHLKAFCPTMLLKPVREIAGQGAVVLPSTCVSTSTWAAWEATSVVSTNTVHFSTAYTHMPMLDADLLQKNT